jgi:ribosome maturation factor RimP
VDIRLYEKIDGIGHFRGKLTGFFEDEGQKILMVDVSGRTHRIPKDLVVKAHLEYEFRDP